MRKKEYAVVYTLKKTTLQKSWIWSEAVKGENN